MTETDMAINHAFDRLGQWLETLGKESDEHQVLEMIADSGLAMVDAAVGAGGLAISAAHQHGVDDRITAMGLPLPDTSRAVINYGMAIPALRLFGTPEQQRELLVPLWLADLACCQLFSEPNAGSDLANVQTTAKKTDGGWLIRGHKVWTSLAQNADIAILVARTSKDKPRHKGLSFFFIDMKQDGIRVEPLRQIDGGAVFNEVFLEDAFVPDCRLIGEVDGGWKVAMGVLEAERASYEGSQPPRGSGPISELLDMWRQRRDNGNAPETMRTDLIQAWISSEVSRLSNRKLAERIANGCDPTEASISKVQFAANAQRISSLALELAGPDILQQAAYHRTSRNVDDSGTTDPIYDYLHNRATSIYGGTTEIQLNIIGDRLLKLPRPKKTERA